MKKQQNASAKNSDRSRKGPEPAVSSARPAWLFRILALAFPVVLLLVLELALRIFGYGYQTSFFLKTEVNGRGMFIDNEQFARRYFPPGLARAPQPSMFTAVKAPELVRIFVLGESAAMGDPEPAYSFGRILEVLLRERWPGKKVEVINAAVTAINSHVIREIARDCAGKQGDYWLVYMGNNEVVGPYGAGTIFGGQTPPLAFIRASIALRATRVGQLLDAARHRLLRRPGTPTTWEGMEMFLKEQVDAQDRRMARVYDHFEKNLGEIVELGRRSGARVLVSSVVSNLKDSPPFASRHSSGMDPSQLAEWDKLYRAGSGLAQATNYAGALEPFQKAALLDDHYAELQFQLGRCHVALGNLTEARKSFEAARDLDTLRFRADTRINQLIRQVASRRGDVAFLDASEQLAQASPHGLAGGEFLYEHVHFNFEGNYRLARLFGEQISGSQSNPAPWLSLEECARRLALSDYDRIPIADEMLKRIQQPPFTGQLDAGLREKRWKEQLDKLRAGWTQEGFNQAVALYRDAIQRRPDDWILRQNFANLWEKSGGPKEAEEQWRAVISLMPHHVPAYYSLANVLDVQGKSAEAITLFHEALKRRPGSSEARNGLGLALASQGKTAEAVEQFQQALRVKPDFAEARVNFGQTLGQQGKLDEAIAQYTEALRANSNHVAAHINLGKLMASQKKMPEAIAHYEAAIRADPNSAVAHYNLANALSAQGSPDALGHYAAAVRAKPDFAEARYNLGLGLAKQGRNSEALAQFAEVVKIDPMLSDARFNLGVALAKERRYNEAIPHFQEVLRLEPNHAAARRFLEQAEAMGGR